MAIMNGFYFHPNIIDRILVPWKPSLRKEISQERYLLRMFCKIIIPLFLSKECLVDSARVFYCH